MTEAATTAPPLIATSTEPHQSVPIERFRELVDLAADFAFETDEWGRFILITPDPTLNWSASDLVGRPAVSLLAEAGGGNFDPFRVSATVRHRQAWLKRGDGGVACLTFSAAPIKDATGRLIGVRGVATDMTERNSQRMAPRRAEIRDIMLRRMGQEATASHMMDAGLIVLASAIGADGVAVVFAATAHESARLAHVTGAGAETMTEIACLLKEEYWSNDGPPPQEVTTADGRHVLIAACRTRSGQKAALIAWRRSAWSAEDSHGFGSVVDLIRMTVEHEAIQLDMSRQAGTDPLTGLLNRRTFLQEIARHTARLDREHQPGTLMFADLDNFKMVNDRMGHDAGDAVLRRTAALLRKTFRPTDLIARLGGDEFAIWMDGADHMTAAERAEHLREAAPNELADVTGPDLPKVTISIGIASRDAADAEPIETLMRRAGKAMYEVKHGGRGHWRVSHRRRPRSGVE